MVYSSDLKNFGDSRPSASNFKSFSRSLEQFFLTVGQNNFGNKIPLLFMLELCNFELAIKADFIFLQNVLGIHPNPQAKL